MHAAIIAWHFHFELVTVSAIVVRTFDHLQCTRLDDRLTD
jgi:hypothetical protein